MPSGRRGSSAQDRGAPHRRTRLGTAPARLARDQIVGLRVAFADLAVRDRVKQAGGAWNPERRVWQLRYDPVVVLGLTSRIVDERVSNSGCPEPSGGYLDTDARAAST